MCRLLPLWFHILASQQVSPTFICMNRNPFEVVASLQKRDGFSRDKAFVLWLSHSLSAELYSRGQPRIFIDFDQVVQNPATALLKIEREAGLVFPVPVNEASKKIEAFVSPGLRHHKANETSEQMHEGIALMAHELHRAFGEMAAGNSAPYDLLDSVAADFKVYQSKWNPELVDQIRYLNQERADYRIKFFRIYKSWSWLLAKPLWLMEKLLRKY
jgi:hypothetical protein